MLTEGATLTVGTHNVKIVRYLSEGGFSKIYEVIMDPAEGGSEIGCLKQVLVPDKNGLNTLRKEVDVMKTLRKARSIVKYYDSNAERLSDGSYQVLVLMELCPNKSLLEYMNDRIRQKLSEPEILKIMLDISFGVYEMHKIKLIHRDIKIENVLIDAKNHFKLCDFGSVAAPIRPARHPQEFQSLGTDILYHTTPQYRSPEMIDLYRGHPIDERSDIWALGCFLYKLCYYTTPFEANGDIAILHASFHFPPAPVFSGDLKNLIIIMLQENPLYRPNIVQILLLVAKLMKTEYKKLDVEDFYGAGEYNFQALHEMQREKHNQILRQQQYYLEQQEQQRAYELSKQNQTMSKSSLRASLAQLSANNSGFIPDENEYGSSEKLDGKHTGEENCTAENVNKLPLPNKDEILTCDQNDTPMDLKAEVVEANDSFSETEDLNVDIPELENIAERYPSLENIHHSISQDEIDSRRSVGLPNLEKNLERDGYESATNRVKSRENMGLPLSETARNQTDFELAEAWKKDGILQSDERTGKLADEIFATNFVGLQKTKSTGSRTSRHDHILETLKPCTPPVLSVENSPYENPTGEILQQFNGLDDQQKLEKRRSFLLPASRLDIAGSIAQPKKVDLEVSSPGVRYDESPKEQMHTADSNLRYKGMNQVNARPEPKRGSSNPWGKALDSPKLDKNMTNPQDGDLGIVKDMSSLNLASKFEEAKKGLTEDDLIDFGDISNFMTDSAKAGELANQLENRMNSDTIAAHKVVEDSLIDMGLDGNGNSKPSFRKPTQPLSFEEKVIDFASDDENHNSEMNRVSIRNSLKKSRKHSDHRRSKTGADGKKRLSFFGGTSE